MKTTFLSIILILLITSCSEKPAPIDLEAEKETLMTLDREFSILSGSDGMKKAFLFYFADDGVLLRPEQRPIEGIEAIRRNFETFSDAEFILTWEPMKAVLSKSADLGYTYGIWESISKDTTNFIARGTYITIWQKNESGEWKAVFDTGNPGI